MKLALHWKIIIGLVLGVLWAILSSSLGLSNFTINWIAPFGTIFINLLKLIAVPLVLFSIITGVAGIGDPSNLGRMGVKTLVFYFVTTVLAVSIGLVLVNIIKPGELVKGDTRYENRISYELWAKANDKQIFGEERLSELAENQALVKTISERSGQEYSDEVRKQVEDKMAKASKTKKSGPLQPLVDIVPLQFILIPGR